MVSDLGEELKFYLDSEGVAQSPLAVDQKDKVGAMPLGQFHKLY